MNCNIQLDTNNNNFVDMIIPTEENMNYKNDNDDSCSWNKQVDFDFCQANKELSEYNKKQIELSNEQFKRIAKEQQSTDSSNNASNDNTWIHPNDPRVESRDKIEENRSRQQTGPLYFYNEYDPRGNGNNNPYVNPAATRLDGGMWQYGVSGQNIPPAYNNMYYYPGSPAMFAPGGYQYENLIRRQRENDETAKVVVNPNDPNVVTPLQAAKDRLHVLFPNLFDENGVPRGAVTGDTGAKYTMGANNQVQRAEAPLLDDKYIDQRGPVHYEFDNPRDLNWLYRFQRDINNNLNTPDSIRKDYWKSKPVQTTFVNPSDLTDEEKDDLNYEHMKEINDKMAEINFEKMFYGNKSSIGLADDNKQDDLATKLDRKNKFKESHKSAQEKMKERKDPNTPTMTTKDFEDIAKSNTEQPRLNPYESYEENASRMFNNQYNSILSSRHQPSSNMYFNNYTYGANPNKPTYYPGYGYNTMGGFPDADGLPTRWFDDGGKYKIPTISDYKKGYVGLVKILHFDTDEEYEKYKEQKHIRDSKKKVSKSKIDLNTRKGTNVMLIKYTTNERGEDIVESIHNSSTNKFLDKEELEVYVNEHPDILCKKVVGGKENDPNVFQFNDIHHTIITKDGKEPVVEYARIIKSVDNQLKDAEGSITVLANEIARYNQKAADTALWLNSVLRKDDAEIVKEKCIEQVRIYRKHDPMAIIKSFVIIIGDKLARTIPKPTTDEEISTMVEECNKSFTDKDKETIGKINTFKTKEEKLEFIQNLRDIEVVLRKDDELNTFLDNIIKDKISSTQRKNFNRYSMYKMLYKSRNKDTMSPEELDKTFQEWWDTPRMFMKQTDYEEAYKNRMNELEMRHFREVWDRAIPMEQVIAMQRKDAYDYWYNTGGFLLKPGYSLKELNEESNYRDQYLAQQKINGMFNKYANGANSKLIQEILKAKDEASKQYGGLDPAAAAIFYDPVNHPEYNAIDLGPNQDLPMDERKQKFVERIFKNVRRPNV